MPFDNASIFASKMCDFNGWNANIRLSSFRQKMPYRAECVERIGDRIDIGTVELLKDLHVFS